MKLIYIANMRLPTDKAHGIQIMKMCEAFALQGIDVELIVPTKKSAFSGTEVFKYYGVKEIFKITKVPCSDLLGKTMAFGKSCYFIDLITFIFGLYWKNLDKGSVIYSRDPMLLIPFLYRKYRIRAEIHSLPAHRYLFFKLLNAASNIIVVTKYLKNELVENGFSAEKIIVAPDAVDIEAFDITISKKDARLKLDLPEDRVLVGYVGMFRTMGMEKGINTAIRSLKFWGDGIMLVLVGGNLKDIDFYKRSAKDLGVIDKVMFVGRVTHDVIPLYLKAFDIFIAPFPDNKHYKYYMSPLKIFEYMAGGRPIITSDLPSIREILSEKNSTLVKPNNPEALAQGVHYLLDTRNLAQKLSHQAFQDVKQYTWSKRARSIISFAKR
ncbi:MAG: hypothetical protein A3G52_02350 [Candidatus Taylorbacteria bacterium RIFCSPLOWO2_12_FULL_43_20]|uniref:Glycosyl transferase family 1 domain-containing protein n=1 Tax=Candidatus Taylorbacteria bacterium RIFCSPLOWO2_12_FULL_43_20 TaxID=1802332 RepID=A0A1G2P3M1_9BACT|nr:MAG: hypothetical protein A3E92_02745 [Candidatus Taylorbacteria bacterium RIFCSPHIGHO2_12_FULL_42_34]OHA42934.1 MAG: hypothetical protein A3G52_02350 [Candidatus Taylorbacteria bacterium RIFCSPLOWO2_12_FULL_43_20]